MTTQYNEIAERAEYEEARLEHNVVAVGDGENPALWREIEARRARCAANAAQVREWEAEREAPVRPEGMSQAEWDEYQELCIEEAAADEWARAKFTRRMEIAGAYSPRCD